MRSVNVAMLAIILILAAVLAIPWKQRPVVLPADTVADASALPFSEAADSSSSLLDPRNIALLFGWRTSPAAVAPTTKESVKPLEASFLTALGYVTKDDGVRYYLFKDQRNQQVFSLATGQSANGWTLTSASPDGFLLAFQGKDYILGPKK
jgi:hypothetical protein